MVRLLSLIHILAALQDFVDRLCTNVGGNAAILMFLVLLGTLVALMIRAGGSKAYGDWAVSHIKTKSGALWSTFIPVSYTHLDVYKRQALCSAMTPEYCTGSSHPAKGTSLPPAAVWRS